VRVDDYHWLRDRDDPDVLAYLEAENAYAADVLGRSAELESALYDEIVARIDETDVTAPIRWGSWWYYERTFEGRSYAVHCRRARAGEEFPTELDDPGEQVVLDENALAEGHDFCSVGVLAVSPDHRLAAVGVDFDGDERHTVTFRSLDGSEAPPESIADVGYSAEWAADSRTLLYVRVDDAWRPHQLWRHVLWTDPAEDVLMFTEPDERFRVGLSKSRDGAVLLVHVSSSMTSEVQALDAADPRELDVVWPRRHGVECALEHLSAPSGEGWWLAVTNDGAVDFRVLAARRGARASFEEIVPERHGTRVDSVDAFATHLVLAERLDGCASVRLLELSPGADPFGADLLERSVVVASDEQPATTVLGATPEFGSPTVRVVQTSLVTPFSSIDVELASGARMVRKRQQVKGGYDPSRFVSTQLWVTARDGVRIPVSIVHRRDLLGPSRSAGEPPAAPCPVLLYGYGAYEICIDPTFAPSRLSLLDRGVIFAIAHVRGGGELGRAWYEAGRLEHKQTTFLDFVDVARDLVARGFTDEAHLAAMGGSAGGLLMGAATNLAPRTFRTVVAEVPFVDVLTTMLDPTLPLTVGEWEEWGDPLHDPEAYRRLKSWSPYDNVVAEEPDGSPRTYPDLLVLGSLNDTRVSYWEPAKWVAKLRAANPSNDVVLKTDLGAGHGGPSGRYDAWRERAMIYAYVLGRLGASASAPVDEES
jgi:oligopeptidase B